jgi:hypothetical protein
LGNSIQRVVNLEFLGLRRTRLGGVTEPVRIFGGN